MEQLNEVGAEDFDEMCDHLEEVYGNAYWALRYGATREDLLNAIDEAFEMHQETQLKDSRVAGSDPKAA